MLFVVCRLVMPPTLEKLKRHIALGLSVCLELFFSNTSFRNSIIVSNSLDPEQAGLGPTCLRRLADSLIHYWQERVEIQCVPHVSFF